VLQVRSLGRTNAFSTAGAGDFLRALLSGLQYDWCLINRERLDARQRWGSGRASSDWH
jgi:hypothetical protein